MELPEIRLLIIPSCLLLCSVRCSTAVQEGIDPRIQSISEASLDVGMARVASVDAFASRRLRWPECDHSVEELKGRLERIRDEASLPHAPWWAGVYSFDITSDLGPTTWIYAAAPRAGALYWAINQTGGAWACNVGTVREELSHRIRIEFERDPGRSDGSLDAHFLTTPMLGSEWFFVTWEDHQFVIPDTCIVAFCCDAADTPRKAANGYARKQGGQPEWSEWNPPRETQPQVPREYKPFLNPTPIYATVIEIGALEGPDDRGITTCVVRVDAGLEQGLIPGMTMRIAGTYPVGLVIAGTATEATVRFRFSGSREKIAQLRLGARASTRREP